MSNHKLHSNRKRPVRSTLKVKSPGSRWLRLLTVVFVMGGFWMSFCAALAEDPNGAPAKNVEESSPPSTPEPPKINKKEGLLFSLMMQVSELIEKDPNSPKIHELLKEMTRVSAELQAEMKAANPASSTSTPPAPDAASPKAVETVPVAKPVLTDTAKEDAEALQRALETLGSQAMTEPEQEEKVEPPAASAQEDAEAKKSDEAPRRDDDIVQLKMKEDVLDLNLLIKLVGQEMKFNFLYETDKGVTGKVRIERYGKIRRRDLLPLLESMLSFSGYTMIREDPFIRIIKRNEAHKKAQPLVVLGDEVPILEVGDSVVAQIVQIKHISVADAKNFLKNFADDQTMVPVPKTNYLIITEYAHRLERLMTMLALVDRPGPDVRLDILPLKHTEAKTVNQQILELLKNLTQQTSSTSSTPAAAAKKTKARRTPRGKGKKTPTPNTPSAALSAEKNGPVLIVDDRLNRIFVIGSEDEINQVKDLLVLLDVPDGPPIRLVPIEVKHVMADEVAQLIISLIQDINKDPGDSSGGRPTAAKPTTKKPKSSSQSRRSSRSRGRGQGSQALKVGDNGPFLHIDERTNRLLLIGSDDQIDQVAELLELLDIPPREYEKLVLRVYRPIYVEAEEARRILSDLGIITSQRRSARQRANQRGRGRDRSRGREDQSRERDLSGDQDRSGRPSDPALLPGEEEAEIRLAVQESSNKLFILATEKQHEDIKDIMDQVDLDAKDALGEIQIYPLENRDPEFVAGMLIELLESTYTETTAESSRGNRILGAENAPIIVALDDIYAIAVRGSQKQHNDIRDIIEILDKRLPSVLVEAILIQVSVDDSLGLGVFLQQDTTVTDDLVNPRRLSGISPFNLGSLTQIGNVIAGSGATVAFFDDDKIFATLEALQEQGNSRIVSRPRILVNDNETGSINSEDQQPTTTTTIPTGSNVPITDFNGYESAGTKLTISPHIGSSESQSLQLEITLNVDSFVGSGSGNVPPPKVVNTVETFVTVPDGMTMVLGGLIREVDSVRKNQVPFLGDLPLIGFLFSNTSRSKDRSILYVFLKAHIVGREGLDEDFQDLKEETEKAKLKLKENKIKGRDLSIFPGFPDKEFEIQSDLFDD